MKGYLISSNSSNLVASKNNNNIKYIFSKIGASIRNVQVKNTNFTAFIEEFTENTYIMVVFSDPKIRNCYFIYIRTCCY